jgi:hypothetical protein
MQMSKKITTAIALLLMMSFAVSLVALPAANAHTPPWTFYTVAYCYATPTPCGVGQQGLIYGWVNVVLANTALTNDIRMENYRFIVTDPNGQSKTYDVPKITDPTGAYFFSYTPDMAGVYNITFLFLGMTYDYNDIYQGDIYEPSNASYLWTVQEEQASQLPQNPLPTDYWSRPINQEQNVNNAMDFGSNWLGGSAQSSGLMTWPPSYIQYNGAPVLTPHVMWTKPIEFGGSLGGTVQQPQLPATVPESWYSGMAYNIRFTSPIIISGVLYFQMPRGYSGGGGSYVAWDLMTGETLWTNDQINPTFATMDVFESPNAYGPGGATLWQISGSTWIGYNAFDGKWEYNITSVPSGTTVRMNDGSMGKYVFSYNRTSQTGWVAYWNTSSVMSSGSDTFSGPGRVLNGAASYAYTFNATINADLTGDTNPTIIGIVPGEAILGASSSLATVSEQRPNHDPWTMWALSDDPATRGSLLWIKHYPAPPYNETQMFATQPIDATTLTFEMQILETGQRLGYSLTTGEKLWGPLGETIGFQYYSDREGVPYNGNFYVSGLGGVLFCYSMLNGSLLWTYGNGGVGNSTNMGKNGPWGLQPLHVAVFAAGVVYTFSGEHSPTNPLYNGELTRAINATTGEEIWTLLDWSGCGLGNSMQSFPIADGYGVMYNCYDSQLYCVGKGPSQVTVTAPNVAASVDTPVVIRGTVTDISAGVKQNEQATRFPNGVPCVSDESMSAWMPYVYENQVMPINVTGVPVSIYVLDSNNNYRQIGTATSDASGMFTYTWTPDIPGDFTIIATFAGSQGYYGSSAETSFHAMAEPEATPAPTPMPQSAADVYFVPAVIGIIVAIVVVGAVLFLMLRKRP